MHSTPAHYDPVVGHHVHPEPGVRILATLAVGIISVVCFLYLVAGAA